MNWKTWLRRMNAGIYAIALIALFLVLTILMANLRGWQWDFTPEQSFTLSPQTLNVLRELDEPVRVRAFVGGHHVDEELLSQQMVDLLREYARQSRFLTVDEIDPVRDPSLAAQYNISEYNTIIFEGAELSTTLFQHQMYGTATGPDSYSFYGEARFTQAIMRVTQQEMPAVYMITGHGGPTFSELRFLRQSLEGDGYVVHELPLLREGKIPENAALIMLIGPQNDLSMMERELLSMYAVEGGSLFISDDIALEMGDESQYSLLLHELGVARTGAIAIEERAVHTDRTALIPFYDFHEITMPLELNDKILIVHSGLALQAYRNQENYVIEPLLMTSQESWGKFEISAMRAGNFDRADGDLQGPLTLAYAVEQRLNREPAAVILGSTVFLLDHVLREQANRDFVLNSIGWLMDEEGPALTIRPREHHFVEQVILQEDQAMVILYGSTIGLPLMFLIIGGILWWRRQRA